MAIQPLKRPEGVPEHEVCMSCEFEYLWEDMRWNPYQWSRECKECASRHMETPGSWGWTTDNSGRMPRALIWWFKNNRPDEYAELADFQKEYQHGDPHDWVFQRLLVDLTKEEENALDIHEGPIDLNPTPRWRYAWLSHDWFQGNKSWMEDAIANAVKMNERMAKTEREGKLLEAWHAAKRPVPWEEWLSKEGKIEKMNVKGRWEDDWKASGSTEDYDYWVHHYAPSVLVGGDYDGNEVCSTCESDFAPGTLKWRPHREDFCNPDCTMWNVRIDGAHLTEEEIRIVDSGQPLPQWWDEEEQHQLTPEQQAHLDSDIASAKNPDYKKEKSNVLSLDEAADIIIDKVEDSQEYEVNCDDPVTTAILSMDRNDKALWTRSGKPRTSVLRKILGRTIRSKERDDAWNNINNDETIIETEETTQEQYQKMVEEHSIYPEGSESARRQKEREKLQEEFDQRNKEREKAAMTREEWESMGQPDTTPHKGSIPSRFKYPYGATDDEKWEFYRTRRDFLGSGYRWNTPEGRELGMAHNAVKDRIEKRVAQEGDLYKGKELIVAVEEAISFHEQKTKSRQHIDFWNKVKNSLVNNNISNDLRYEVLERSSGARSGAKFL